MFCRKCGAQMADGVRFCPNCGASVSENTVSEKDGSSWPFALIGFFIPIAGLVLYLVYMDTHPLKAKSAIKGAVVGFVAQILLVVLVFVFVGIITVSVFSMVGEYDAAYYAASALIGMV